MGRHGWTCIEPGLWEDSRGRRLERRRAEPGAPAGWYLFCPDIFGHRMGSSLHTAIVETECYLREGWRALP